MTVRERHQTSCREKMTGVYQFYHKTGKYVAEFESIKKASKKTGIAPNRISLCCSGKAKHAGGFIWIRQSDYL